MSKAEKASLDNYKEGVHLEQSSGRTVSDLQQQACADRLHLAEGFLKMADRLMRTRPPMHRAAVGRYYYAMYHAMRAVVYFDISGDDHEQHSVLPKATPKDFPNPDYWKNELKDARLRRNEADYDPYPALDSDFRDAANHLKAEAHKFLVESRGYLKRKGCVHL